MARTPTRTRTPSPPLDSGPSTAVNDGTRCPICGENIAATARKCIHCASELSWRRYMSLSSNTLALLTALIAVLGAVGPSIKSLFEHQDAFIDASFVGANAQRRVRSDGREATGVALLLASNEGHRSGALVGAELRIVWKVNGRQRTASTSLWMPNDEPVIIRPQSGTEVRLLIDSAVSPGPATSKADLQALIIPPQGSFDLDKTPMWRAYCSIALSTTSASDESTHDMVIMARCPTLLPAVLSALRSGHEPIIPLR